MIDIPSKETWQRIQEEIGHPYPPSFYALLPDLNVLQWERIFPHGRFVKSTADAQNPRLPQGALPFFVQEQGDFVDYYYFDTTQTGPEYAVNVFSVHATVASWPNFAAWVSWVKDSIGNSTL